MLPSLLSRKDARDYQIIFLLLFLGLGIYTRDWSIDPLKSLVILTSCLFTQALMGQGTGFKSALITALGLILLLRSDNYVVLGLAGSVAIASKFLFQAEGKHWFNPANFGIVCALLGSGQAWVSPGQWGQEGLYALLFLCLGGMILRKVGRWDTTASFLLVYVGLEAVRNFWLGWEIDVLSHQLLNGSLLLFAFFMITDPRSIPNARQGRILWAVAIACVTFLLRNWFFISSAPFYALFLVSPFTVLIDRAQPAPRFHWVKKPVPLWSLS